MKISKKWLVAGAGLAGAIAAASPAHAQATRTFVSAVGDDANPCSRTAPCRTFAGTISKTATGGEINCIDPGSFGTVTIAKSITIDCTGMVAGQTSSTTTGIIVNPPAGSRVILRGISITGAPSALPGNFGIRVVAPVSLVLDDVVIQDFNAASPNGIGISVTNASGEVRLYATNLLIAGNGTAAFGGGINFAPTGTGSIRAVLTGVNFLDNNNSGLTVNTTGATGGTTQVTVRNSTFSGNGGVGVALSSAAASPISLFLKDSAITNGATGIVANGTSTTGRVSNTAITGNATGLLVVGGASLLSYGNNEVDGNGTNGAFTGALLPTK